MRLATHVLAVLAFVAFSSMAFAEADAGGAKKEGVHKARPMMCKIVRVDGDKVVVSSGKADAAKESTLATDATTVVTIDGQPGALADLKADQHAQVTPGATADAPVMKIEVLTKAPAKKEGAKKDGAKKDGAKKNGAAAH